VRKGDHFLRKLPLVLALSASLLAASPAGAHQPDCDVVASPGQSFSSLMAALGANDTACLAAGTYTWGDYYVPAAKTIKGSDDPGVATVIGEARLSRPGVTLSDLRLQATGNETHAVVDVKANDTLVQFADVDVAGRSAQAVIVGGSSIAPSNVHLLDLKIHDVAGGTLYHGVYIANAVGVNEIARTWMWNITGYGLHFYSTSGRVTGFDVHHTVLDDAPNRGHVFDGPAGNTLRDSVVTAGGPVNCNRAGNTLTNVRSRLGFARCAGTGLATADTAYVNKAARDYRNAMPGHDFIAGPRF
jgi:hypothetical protein